MSPRKLVWLILAACLIVGACASKPKQTFPVREEYVKAKEGLVATQFNKPAIIISGKWKHGTDGSSILMYQTTEYQVEYKIQNNFQLSLYYDLHNVEYQMMDGDLAVLDADEGILQVLGQERDTIALFEELKSLGKTNEEIAKSKMLKSFLFYAVRNFIPGTRLKNFYEEFPNRF